MRKSRHNAECFASHMGIWLCEPDILKQAHSAILAGTFPVRAMEDDGGDGGDDADAYAISADGIACITIAGPMAKAAGKYASAGTVALRQQIREAAADPAVKAIVLCIDSPGGTVAGTQALADEVGAANKIKPVIAQIEDMGASAAYWVASQACAVFANESALVGSLGTYGVVYDSSGQAAMQGVKVHVLSTGPHKGAFVDGAPVTNDQLKERQAMVDDLNELFIRSVSAGRKMPSAADLFDGRVHVAAKARELGLIDRVQSLDQTLSMLANSPGRMLGGSFVRASGGAGATGAIEATSDQLPSSVIRSTEENSMPSKSLEQVAALIEKHPARAVMISALAAKDSTEEAIVAAIAAADAADKLAGLESAVKSKDEQIAALSAELDAEKAKAVAAEAARAELKAQHNALAALKAGADEGRKVKVDGAPPKQAPKASAKDYESMSGLEKAAFHREGGTVSAE